MNIANESGGHTVQLHTAGNTFNGGNVGIGDSSPNHKLDVAGNIGLMVISILAMMALLKFHLPIILMGMQHTLVVEGTPLLVQVSLPNPCSPRSVSSEDLYLGADSNIYLFTYTDTIANRKQALKADTSGRVFVGSGSSSSIGYSTNVFNVVTPYGTEHSVH